MSLPPGLPEVTPCVLFKRIVPYLRKQGWEVTRGRGLEEGDRIYRPGCKAKGRFAKRNEDFFLCYDDYDNANPALVDFVFDNGNSSTSYKCILIPQQVWMPHELSTQASTVKPEVASENVAPVANGVAAEETPKPHHSKKRPGTPNEEEVGENADRPPKRRKKTKAQQPLPNAQSQHLSSIDRTLGHTMHAVPTVVGNLESQRGGNSDMRKLVVGECGETLLQGVRLTMLDFVTVVNRRWRSIKDAARPDHGRSEEITALTSDIQESQQDLNCEIQDAVEWVNKHSASSVNVAAWNVQLPQFESNTNELLQLLKRSKLFVQQLVVVVRRYRRSLCALSGPACSRPSSEVDRPGEWSRMMPAIAVLQDDLREGLKEISATAELVSYDSEKTDTDDDEA